MGWLGKIVKGVAIGAAIGAISVATGGTATFAFIGTALGATAATAGIIGTAIAFGGLTAASMALQKKPKAAVQQDLAARLSIRTDGNAGRYIPYGLCATAGQLIFKGYTGTDNNTLHMVLVLAGSTSDSLQAVKVNGKAISLPASYPYGAITTGNFADKLKIYFHDGRDTTTPFSGASLHTLGAWTAKTRKLRGITAVYIEATIDEDFDGRFEPLFTFKGRQVYDPRKDSTAGGSGTHRVDDEATWEWAANPILAAHDYALGIRTNGVQVAGIGFAASQFDYSQIAAEADDCDDAVALKAGGTEPRYECNGFIDSKSDHRTNLDTLAASMAARWTFANNRMSFYAGTFHAAAITLDAGDMVGEPASFRRWRGKKDRVNTIRGVFADPSSDYTVQSYPTWQDADAVTADGQTLYAQLDLQLVTSHTQCQRIAKIYGGRSRAMRAMGATLTHHGLNAVPGEIAAITYARFGLSASPMVITAWEPQFASDGQGNTGLVVPMAFEDEDAAWYAWDEDTEEQSFTSPTPLVRQASAYPIASVSGNLGWSRVLDDNGNAPADNADVTANTPEGQQARAGGTNLLPPSAGSTETTSSYGYFLSGAADGAIAGLGLVPGDVVSMGVHCRNTTFNDIYGIKIECYNSSDAYVGGASSATTNSFFINRRIIENFTIPAETAYFKAFVNAVSNSPTNNTVEYKWAQLNKGPIALPFSQPPFEIAGASDLGVGSALARSIWMTVDSMAPDNAVDLVAMVNGIAPGNEGSYTGPTAVLSNGQGASVINLGTYPLNNHSVSGSISAAQGAKSASAIGQTLAEVRLSYSVSGGGSGTLAVIYAELSSTGYVALSPVVTYPSVLLSGNVSFSVGVSIDGAAGALGSFRNIAAYFLAGIQK